MPHVAGTHTDLRIHAMQGYGAALAFLPANISLGGLSAVSNYVSNGNTKLPMIIQVLDQAGSAITSGASINFIHWTLYKPLGGHLGPTGLE